jgi:2-keto-4-pentenoate hydratase
MSDFIEQCSARLWNAERERSRITPLSIDHPTLSENDAYAIAAQTFKRRGRRHIGYKLGFTSAAMRAQMNISQPNFGLLTEDMLVPENTGRIDSENLVHPLIEPEVALLVGRDLRGPGHTRASVYAAIDAAMASLEIVDTRYQSYKFAAVDNIADNSSSARIVLGPPKSFKSIDDLRLCGALLWSRGELIDQGIGANALGDPLLAIAWLANFLALRDSLIPAGSVVLTGGLTRAYPADKNQNFVAEFAQLGVVLAAF